MKLKTLFAATLLMFSLSACDFLNTNTKESEDNEIVAVYKLYKSSGGTMDYDDWLESIKGDDGQDGKDGTSLLTGNGNPVSSLGNNGDSYIDLDTWDLFVKDNSGWHKEGNIKGRDGKDGRDGENGQNGVNGKNGASIITENGEPSNNLGNNGDSYIDLDTWNYYVKENNSWYLKGSIKGSDGNNGSDGTDGINGDTPYIGQNGNWWIGTNDSGVPAQGQPGQNGTNGSNGANGLTPFIGDNNNWWIGTTDTGVNAVGTSGKDAETISQIAYDKNGNLIFTFSDGTVVDAGKIANACEYDELNNTIMRFDICLYDGESCAILKKIELGRSEVSYDDRITIPSIFEGYVVKGIANEFGEVLDSSYSRYPWLNLVIPETVEFIGARAFQNAKFSSLALPNSCKYIKEEAFKNCTNLRDLIIEPSSKLESISDDVFAGCTSLKSLYIPEKLRFRLNPKNVYFETFTIHENSNYYTKNSGLYYKYASSSGEVIIHSLEYYPSTATATTLILDDDCRLCPLFNNQYLRTLILKAETVIQSGLIDSCFNLEKIVLPNNLEVLSGFITYDSNLPDAQARYQQQIQKLRLFYPGTEQEYNSISGNHNNFSFPTYFYSDVQPDSVGNYWHYVNGVPIEWDYDLE